MTYPFGYLYPNEFAEPLVWLPVLFAYSLLISGADVLILALSAYLFGRLKKAIPLLLTLGLALFTVVLLGPLADLKNPDRAPLLFSHAQIWPTETHPGVSLIALMGGVVWPLAWILAILFTLLYFSYPLHVKCMATRNPLYKILSLGVSTPERYKALRPLLKVLAALALIPLALWAVYPVTLFVMQTSIFLWQHWTLLPAIYFADVFVTATAVAILAVWVMGRAKLQQFEVPSLVTIHGAASIAVAALLLIQLWIWNNRYGLSHFYTAFAPVISWTYAAVALFLLTFILSLVASRYLTASLVIPFTGLAAAIFNKWNVIVRAQAGMRSGLTFLEPGGEYFAHEIPLMVSIVAFAVFLAIVLTSIFPLEVRNHD